MPTVSHSWKASLPIRCVGHLARDARPCGMESINASVSAVTALVAPGSRGHQDHADLARGARIAFRRMGGALLVADQDVLDLWPAGTARHRSAGPRRRDSRRYARRPGRPAPSRTISAPDRITGSAGAAAGVLALRGSCFCIAPALSIVPLQPVRSAKEKGARLDPLCARRHSPGDYTGRPRALIRITRPVKATGSLLKTHPADKSSPRPGQGGAARVKSCARPG
jgi:hypothetical protein